MIKFLCPPIIYFSTNKLGFTPEFLGRVKLVTSIASLLGVGLYNYFLKEIPLRKIFLVTTIIGSALGMTQVPFCAIDLIVAGVVFHPLNILHCIYLGASRNWA